jgi:hypothetical protein
MPVVRYWRKADIVLHTCAVGLAVRAVIGERVSGVNSLLSGNIAEWLIMRPPFFRSLLG